MITEEILGCGVAEHDESCLCDVVIVKPLPPLKECFRDAVEEMWMGRELCELKDYCAPWTREKTLSYLEDLKTFYDEYHHNPVATQLSSEDETLRDLNPISRDEYEPLNKWWDRIRKEVQYGMDNLNDSLCDIVKQLGLTPQEFIDAATLRRAGDDWDWEKLNMLDEMFSIACPILAHIQRKTGCTKDVIKGLKKYWVPRRMRIGVGDNPNPARVLLGKLALDPSLNLSNREICAIVEKEYGVKYESSTVSKIKRRTKSRL